MYKQMNKSDLLDYIRTLQLTVAQDEAYADSLALVLLQLISCLDLLCFTTC